MRECDKSKNTCKQQLPIVCMSFNNVGHLITSTITTLQHFATLYHTSPNYTSLHLSKLHFLSFALHYSPVWLDPSTLPIVLFHPPITKLVSCNCPLIKKTSNYHLRNLDSSVIIVSRHLSEHQRNRGSIRCS